MLCIFVHNYVLGSVFKESHFVCEVKMFDFEMRVGKQGHEIILSNLIFISHKFTTNL